MKLSTVSIAVALSAASAAPTATLEKRTSSIQGFDISNHQPYSCTTVLCPSGSVNIPGAYSSGGARFVIIKVKPYPYSSATDGTSFIDTTFSSHYTYATSIGLIRGGYHFARPDESSGSIQATFFLANGGGWTGDGRTLPGMLDIEYNPNGDTCYWLSKPAMVTWVQDFVNTYHSETGRYPMIYTTSDWWNSCTDNSAAFSTTCPLVLSHPGSSPGMIPGGWPFQTIWQNGGYTYGGDSDLFNGDLTQLKKLATG